MATMDMRVISEMIRTRTMEEAKKAGFHEDLIKDADALTIYRFINEHYNNRTTYKQIPAIEEIKRRFGFFTMVSNDPLANSVGSMVQHLKMRAMETDLVSIRDMFDELIADNSEEDALNVLVAQLPNLIKKYKKSAGFGVSGILEGMKAAYEGARSGAALGIPWPWDCLTEDTLGKNKGDFVVFYGRMKSMKTWLILKCAVDDYIKYNQRVIIWSREMDARKMQLRLASLIAGVDYQLLKKGTLPPNLYRKAVNTIEQLERKAIVAEEDKQLRGRRGYADLIVLAGPDAPRSVEDLKGAIGNYQPDVVYLDSFYHMQTGRAGKTSQMWAQLQYLAEDIKGLALDENIPIIGAAQANRLGEKLQGENLTEMAGSDAIAREADLLIRVIKKGSFEVEGMPGEVKTPFKVKVSKKMAERAGIPTKCRLDSDTPLTGAELVLILPGNREGVLEAFSIHCIPGYNFEVTNSHMSGESARDLLSRDDKETSREIRKGGSDGKKRPKAKKQDDQPEIPFSLDFRKKGK